ncbi:hypothetical protein Tco_1564408 [Tanacetum coccineum]
MNVTPPDAYSDGTLFGGVTDWYPKPRIHTTVPATTPTMTPSTTHIDTTLTPTEIPTVSPLIPPSPDYTPASSDYSPASDTELDPSEDLSSDHIPPLPATSPFLSSTDDSSDSNTPDTPPSPTHEITPVEVVPPASKILPAPFSVHRRRAATHDDCEEEVGLLLTHPLAVRHSVDYSLSDYFTSDDSSRDSLSDSSSETPSDSSSDPLSNFSSGHSFSNHPSSALLLGMRSSHPLCSLVPSIPHLSAAITERPYHFSHAGPSRKRSRYPTTSISLSSPIPGALSYIRADLLPPRKRIKSLEIVTGLEDCSDEGFKPFIPRETGSRADIEVGDALRAEGIDDRVMVETVSREEVEMSARGIVVVSDDRVTHLMVPDNILEPAHEEGAIEVIESIQGGQGHMIVASSQQGTMMSERISKLERDNTRLRGMLDVASQRVTCRIDIPL